METISATESFVMPFFTSGYSLIDKKDFRNQALGRLNFGTAGLVSLISTPVDNIGGIACGIFSLFGEVYESLKSEPNWKSWKNVHTFTIKFFKSCEGLGTFFAAALHMFNPYAFPKTDDSSLIDSHGSGLISHHVRVFINSLACNVQSSDWRDCVIAKIIYSSLIPLCLVTRITDFALAVLAAPFAFITAGRIPNLNYFAYRGLMIDGFIQDVFLATTKIINLDFPIILDDSTGKLRLKNAGF